MDAFYASVELLRYPQLMGLPVVIGGSRRRPDDTMLKAAGQRPLCDIPISAFPLLKDYTGRGVITTSTYAARKFGVGSAMGLMKAAKQCPQAILLPVDFDEYRKYSRMFKSEIIEIAPIMEDRGIDEVFFDLTNVPGAQDDGGRMLAEAIQASILKVTGLTCSIGVAPNKLIAKMASEFNKPNGISIVYETDVERMIWPLPCRKINGIGPKADEKLMSFGIRTIGELAMREHSWLLQHFGKSYGTWLFNAARGKDDRPVQTHSEPVSMSRETTFERDMHAVRDKEELGAIFTRLCEQVAADLQRKGYVGKTIGIKLRYDDFKIATRDHTVDSYTNDEIVIRRLAGQCLKRVPLERRLRLIGVRVGSLEKAANVESALSVLLNGATQPPTRVISALSDKGGNLPLFEEL
ncbi:impB/mucB/samB family protein [Collimonas fungivorans]|uniref:DNA polymerase IV n=2 Tax=Collimonas fungivorans TaxID=158899 RepID=A0A127PCV8_9BURK|nr:DNA polymerase IV [Collimonas fungivorans]AMO95543.1 impB/mucB/samB family protein [Collimonas fungivorans]